MCLSCGCKQPNEDHGDKRNITMATLEDAAQAANISVDDVCQNLDEGVEASQDARSEMEQKRRAS